MSDFKQDFQDRKIVIPEGSSILSSHLAPKFETQAGIIDAKEILNVGEGMPTFMNANFQLSDNIILAGIGLNASNEPIETPCYTPSPGIIPPIGLPDCAYIAMIPSFGKLLDCQTL